MLKDHGANTLCPTCLRQVPGQVFLLRTSLVFLFTHLGAQVGRQLAWRLASPAAPHPKVQVCQLQVSTEALLLTIQTGISRVKFLDCVCVCVVMMTSRPGLEQERAVFAEGEDSAGTLCCPTCSTHQKRKKKTHVGIKVLRCPLGHLHVLTSLMSPQHTAEDPKTFLSLC